MVERVLDYNRDIVAQETGYWIPGADPHQPKRFCKPGVSRSPRQI
jgi:hypothetical protein